MWTGTKTGTGAGTRRGTIENNGSLSLSPCSVYSTSHNIETHHPQSWSLSCVVCIFQIFFFSKKSMSLLFFAICFFIISPYEWVFFTIDFHQCNRSLIFPTLNFAQSTSTRKHHFEIELSHYAVYGKVTVSLLWHWVPHPLSWLQAIACPFQNLNPMLCVGVSRIHRSPPRPRPFLKANSRPH